MSCRLEVPDGRPRQFDVTAAALSESRRVTFDLEAPPTPAPKAPEAPKVSRTQELCISAGILVGILSALGIVIVALS